MASVAPTSGRPVLTLAELEAFDPTAPARDGERRFCCPLPGCADKPRNAAHRSLSVNVVTGGWTCYRCGVGGQLQERWQPKNRLAAVRRAFGVPGAAASAVPQVPAPAAPEWRAQLHQAVHITVSDAGKGYLATRGIPAELAIAANLAFSPAWFGRPAVLFAVRDRAGALVAAQGRYIDGGTTPKARTAGTLKLGAFTTPGALEADPLVIVEAPIDALSLAVVGVPAIALCGTHAPTWLPFVAGLRRVALALDADHAGDEACARLGAQLRSFGAHIERWRPAGRKDWNEQLVLDGHDLLRAVAAYQLEGGQV